MEHRWCIDEAWIMHEECMEEGNAKYLSYSIVLILVYTCY